MRKNRQLTAIMFSQQPATPGAGVGEDEHLAPGSAQSYALCTACYVSVQRQAVHAANALGYHNTSRGQSVSPLWMGKVRLSRASAVFPSWWSLAGNTSLRLPAAKLLHWCTDLEGQMFWGPRGLPSYERSWNVWEGTQEAVEAHQGPRRSREFTTKGIIHLFFGGITQISWALIFPSLQWEQKY